jgi:hypothetical protein
MTNDERNKGKTVVPGVIRYIRRDLTTKRREAHSPLFTNRVALAVVGPAAVERARDIDRSLLPSASPQE